MWMEKISIGAIKKTNFYDSFNGKEIRQKKPSAFHKTHKKKLAEESSRKQMKITCVSIIYWRNCVFRYFLLNIFERRKKHWNKKSKQTPSDRRLIYGNRWTPGRNSCLFSCLSWKFPGSFDKHFLALFSLWNDESKKCAIKAGREHILRSIN
jgi:hypothetical protein